MEFGSQDLSERGNLVKTIGQPAAVTNNAGEAVLEFRVDAIEQDAPCEAEYAIDGPENGQFLAVQVYASTTATFDSSLQDGYFLGSAASWSVVTADGVRHRVDTPAAYTCAPSSVRELEALTPSITVSGTVYLDAPADLTGALVIVSTPTIEGGWEWAVPA